MAIKSYIPIELVSDLQADVIAIISTFRDNTTIFCKDTGNTLRIYNGGYTIIDNLPIPMLFFGFIDGEVPSGTINGINGIFTTAYLPIINSLRLFLNGQRLKKGQDYTISTSIITMTTIPFTGDTLTVDYTN